MARKKKISSWKQKKAFDVVAPESFNNQFLGQSVAAEAKNLLGRTITVSAKDLTEDRTKQQFNITFEITDVEGDTAKTKFKRFEVASGYMRSKVRKRMSKVDYRSDITVGEDKARVKIMISAGRRVSKEQKKQLSEKIRGILDSHKNSKAEDVVQMVVFGKLGTEIFHGVKNIAQIHRVEVQEIRVI
ncbi:MAG: hypothetical protein ABH834_05100 [Candidatus Altiarchaeota archaeon]